MSNWREDTINNIGTIQERSCPSLDTARIVLDDVRFRACKITLHPDSLASFRAFEERAKASTCTVFQTVLYKPGGRAITQHAVRSRRQKEFKEHVEDVFDPSKSDVFYNENVAAVRLLRYGTLVPL